MHTSTALSLVAALIGQSAFAAPAESRATGTTPAKLDGPAPQVGTGHSTYCGADRYGIQFPRYNTTITLDGKNPNGFTVPIIWCSGSGTNSPPTNVDVYLTHEVGWGAPQSGDILTKHHGSSSAAGLSDPGFRGFYFNTTIAQQKGGFYERGEQILTVIERANDASDSDVNIGSLKVNIVVTE